MPRQDQSQKWLKLLGDEVRKNQNEFEKYPENFRLDLPEQEIIHQDCQSLENKAPIFEESDLKNALELLLTYYCKTEELEYQTGLHEVLAPFFLMRFSNLKTVYGAFSTFVQKMLPNMFVGDVHVDLSYNLFQKLIMYHEPILFNTIQSSFPSHTVLIKKWLLTGMASLFDSSNLLKLWEFCLSQQNYTLPVYVAITVLYRQREKLMKKTKSKKLLNFDELDLDDIQEIIKEAIVYQANTPLSFQKKVKKMLFDASPKKSLIKLLENSSIVTTSPKDLQTSQINYVVIDIRDGKEFAKSHFLKSFNISQDLQISTGK